MKATRPLLRDLAIVLVLLGVYVASIRVVLWWVGPEPSPPPPPESAVLAEGDEDLGGLGRVGPPTGEVIYFVMVDRFANGDPANDTGAGGADPSEHGFDPARRGYYHGGDLAGLRDRLDYIQGLGATALWLTPVLTNLPVQGSGPDASAGYHGYWTTDFTQVDPHLGSNEDLVALVQDAHARGMKVYLDVVVNHTADVISYRGVDGPAPYVDTATQPYRDVDGEPFDDTAVAGSPDFPDVDLAAFPYTPVVADDLADVKAPTWLNDLTMYHNRGDSTFEGESVLDGDFVGLDDLWTERPDVVAGMTEIYADLLAWTGVDGFRLDTVRHVDVDFWQRFVPALEQAARDAGVEDFLMFGEVWAPGDVVTLLEYGRRAGIPALLDFALQDAVSGYASGAADAAMCDILPLDFLYADADSDAYAMPTFAGNHDMGRIGYLLRAEPDPQTRLRRAMLAYETLFVLRGQPVVYYGDEQGFTGAGGDQLARQDMFASQTPEYLADDRLGTDAGHDVDAYDPTHPMYTLISRLAAVRAEHPALADGPTVIRRCADTPGPVVLSRVDRREGTEYVVVLSSSTQAEPVRVRTWSPNTSFTTVYASDGTEVSARTGANALLTVSAPPLGVLVLAPDRPMPQPDDPPTVSLDVLTDQLPGWAVPVAVVPSTTWTSTTFLIDRDGEGPLPRQVLARDDAPKPAPDQMGTPGLVAAAAVDLAGLDPGTTITLTAVVADRAGHQVSTTLDWTVPDDG